MAYKRKTYTDNLSKWKKEDVDNLQDGIDEAKNDIATVNNNLGAKIYSPVSGLCENGLGTLIQQRIGSVVYCTLNANTLIYTINPGANILSKLNYLPLYNFAVKVYSSSGDERFINVNTSGAVTNGSTATLPSGKTYLINFSYVTSS